MDKLKELMMQTGSAEKEVEKEPPVEIEGLSAIRAELERIARAQEERGRERHEAMVAAVNRLADAVERSAASENSEKVDLGPLIEAVRSLKEPPESEAPPAYRVEIERDSRALMSSATFIPLKKDLH